MPTAPILVSPRAAHRSLCAALCLLGLVLQLGSAAATAAAEGQTDQLNGTVSGSGSGGRARRPRIAIIGAGIGGASTAYFLNKLLAGHVTLHVYEKGGVGGRLKNLRFGNESYELGGSMVYQDNMYIRDLAEAVGLRVAAPEAQPHAVDEPFALYDGQRFVFNESSWSAITMLRMGLRYGTAPLRFRALPLAMFDRFVMIYALQSAGVAFERPEELLQRVGLLALTQQSFASCLKEQLGSDAGSLAFATEFSAAVNRVNYNQGNHINAFAGMVSMLPAVDSRVFKIVGGNALLPERLLAAAGARMKSGWVVDTVRPGRSGRFELHARRRRHHGGQAENSAASQSKRGGEEGAAQRDGEEGCPGMGPGPAERRAEAEVKAAAAREEEAAAAIRKSSWDQEVAGPYDALVIAAPLEHSAIEFRGLRLAHRPKRRYQQVVTTYVVGSLRAAYFGVATLPSDQVLVTEAAETPFSVVAPLRRLPCGRTLYKLFSVAPIGHLLPDMFADHVKVAEKEWYAYPQFSPPERFSPFKLAPGIFYNNAWENAASAMEMSAIAAHNSALLVKEHLFGRPELARQRGGQLGTESGPLFTKNPAAAAA